MPGPLLGTAIAAGAQVLGTGINAATTNANNKNARRHAESMYRWQRQDALSDWHMQNEYNSPAEQMKRLRAAGLNPNLVYGTGSATSNVAPIRSSSMDVPKSDPVQVDFSGVAQTIMQYQQQKQIDVQTDNLAVQGEVLRAEKALKEAQLLGILTETENKRFDLDLKGDLRTYTLEAARQNLDKTLSEIRNIDANAENTISSTRRAEQLQPLIMQATADANSRANEIQKPTMQKIMAEIRSMAINNAKTDAERRNVEQNFNNLKEENVKQKLENAIRQSGLNPSDPTWQRLLVRILENASASLNRPNPSPAPPGSREDGWFDGGFVDGEYKPKGQYQR